MDYISRTNMEREAEHLLLVPACLSETGFLALLIYEYKILKIFQTPPGVGHSHGPWLLQDMDTKRAGWFDIIVDNRQAIKE